MVNLRWWVSQHVELEEHILKGFRAKCMGVFSRHKKRDVTGVSGSLLSSQLIWEAEIRRIMV
jgi:hypothetical protein